MPDAAVILASLLHDLGTLTARATGGGGSAPNTPDEPAGAAGDHARLSRELFDDILRPRLAGLLDQNTLADISSAVATHHQPSSPLAVRLARADALASGLMAATADPADERFEPAEAPHTQALLCPVCREGDRLSGEGSRLPAILEPASLAAPLSFPVPMSHQTDYRAAYAELLGRLRTGLAEAPTTSLTALVEALAGVITTTTAGVPTARGQREPAVSLADHLLWTAAIAQALAGVDPLTDTATNTTTATVAGTADPADQPTPQALCLLALRLGEGAERPEITGAPPTPLAALRDRDRTFVNHTARATCEHLGLLTVAVVRRTSREWVILAGDTPRTHTLWAAWRGRLAQFARDHFGLMRSVQLAALPVGLAGLAPFGPAYRQLVDLWDAQARQPLVWTWADPTLWHAPGQFTSGQFPAPEAPPTAGAPLVVMALAAQRPETDSGQAGDTEAPAAFSTLERRLAVFFSTALADHLASLGGTLLDSGPHHAVITVPPSAALALPLALADSFARFVGQRHTLGLSVAIVSGKFDSDTVLHPRWAEAALARSANFGPRVVFDGVPLIWDEYRELAHLAETLLAGPIRAGRLSPDFLAELSRSPIKRFYRTATDQQARLSPAAHSPARVASGLGLPNQNQSSHGPAANTDGPRRGFALPPRLLSRLAVASADPELSVGLVRKIARPRFRRGTVLRLVELALSGQSSSPVSRDNTLS